MRNSYAINLTTRILIVGLLGARMLWAGAQGAGAREPSDASASAIQAHKGRTLKRSNTPELLAPFSLTPLN